MFCSELDFNSTEIFRNVKFDGLLTRLVACAICVRLRYVVDGERKLINCWSQFCPSRYLLERSGLETRPVW